MNNKNNFQFNDQHIFKSGAAKPQFKYYKSGINTQKPKK